MARGVLGDPSVILRMACDATTHDYFEGALWLTKTDQHHHPQKDMEAASAVHRGQGREVRAKAEAREGASISAARKCASSAPRRLRQSTTKTCACSHSLSPRVERSCLAGLQVYALRINGG